MNSAVKIKNLTKSFGDVVAVNNISLEVSKGKIFGLLGSNGAGKTTMINMLIGLLLPDKGRINILGQDVRTHMKYIRKIISLVPQTISLYESLTVYENLDFFGGMFLKSNKELKERIDSLLCELELEDHKNVLVSQLSGGFQRRCSIACALVSNPKILLMDEPLTGIDLKTNKIVMNLLSSMEDVTIILTTHSMREAEAACDEIVFLDRGRKILEGNPRKLVRKYANRLKRERGIKKPGLGDVIDYILDCRKCD